MPQLRLSDPDRVRLGVTQEWLVLDWFSVTNREAIALAKLGYRTPGLWRRELWKGLDKDADDFGEVDFLAWTCAVWLALRRAGVDVEVGELEFDWDSMQFRGDNDTTTVEEDPGKGSATGPSGNDAAGPTPTVT